MTYKIEEGDLLAYLEGNAAPHVQQALHESPELQAELIALRQLDTCLRQKLKNRVRFDTQDIIDVITGQATEEQRLMVAAQVQSNATVKAEMERLQAEYIQMIA